MRDAHKFDYLFGSSICRGGDFGDVRAMPYYGHGANIRRKNGSAMVLPNYFQKNEKREKGKAEWCMYYDNSQVVGCDYYWLQSRMFSIRKIVASINGCKSLLITSDMMSTSMSK